MNTIQPADDSARPCQPVPPPAWRPLLWLTRACLLLELGFCVCPAHGQTLIASTNQVTFSLGLSNSFSVVATGFSVTPTLSETGALPSGVSFTNNGTDGTYPDDGVILGKAALYGTTTAGGPADKGTVFAITP